jgi:hypothetical protein
MGLTCSFLANQLKDIPKEGIDYIYYNKLNNELQQTLDKKYLNLFQNTINDGDGLSLLIANGCYHLSSYMLSNSNNRSQVVLTPLLKIKELIKQVALKEYIIDREDFPIDTMMFYVYNHKSYMFTGKLKIKYLKENNN